MLLGGGYGLMQNATDLAGITANYQLGRGNLAAGLANDEFDRNMQLSQAYANPFNIVSALDMNARLGGGYPINSPIVESIDPWMPQIPGSRYTDVADRILGMPDQATRQRIQQAYATDPVAAERFFSQAGGAAPAAQQSAVLGAAVQPGGGGTVAPIAAPQGAPRMAQAPSSLGSMSLNDVRRENRLTETPQPLGMRPRAMGGSLENRQRLGRATGQGPAPVPMPTVRAPAAGGASSTATRPAYGAQQAASRLLGQGITVGQSSPQFRDTLRRGQVAGLGAINEADFGRLTGDQQSAYAGILQSTGRVSDAGKAIEEHFRRFRIPGMGRGRVYR